MRLAKPLWMVFFTLALWLMFALANPGVGWSQAKYGGTLVMVHNDPDIMNPVTAPGWIQFQRMCFNGLIDYDEKGNIIPGIATSWEISKDGLIYTFQLRQDVKWHDGEVLTAEDVKFSYEKILDPKLASRFNLPFQSVKDVQVLSPSTVVITLKHPDPVFLGHLWVGIIPKHIWEKEDFAQSQYNVKPVGSGPWKLKTWARGDHMIFEANPGYFLGRPYLDRIIVKVIPDATVAFAALEKGDVDYFPFTGVVGGPPYQLVNRLKQSEHLEVKVFDAVSTQRLFFRNDKPPFNNLKVRQAVAHAINKQFIVDKLLFGYGQVTHSEVPSALTWAHNPDVPQYEYNVDKANQLLDEAGYPKGSGGIRFRTRIYGNPGVRAILSEIIKEHLKAVGIAADVVIQEWASYAHSFRIARTIDGLFTIFSLYTVPDPSTEAVRYHTNQIKPGGQNYLFYNNSQVDAIIEETQATLDREKRVKLFYAYQDILAQEVPMIPLYTLTGVDIWNKKFTGFGVTQWGGGPIAFLEKVQKTE